VLAAVTAHLDYRGGKTRTRDGVPMREEKFEGDGRGIEKGRKHKKTISKRVVHPNWNLEM
jgi:hypothetical protein